MSGVLSRFRIEALHHRHTIDVPINDNKLVLIGENGTGKSTVANFIYFFLTNQWDRMLDYEFKSVLATIDAKTIEITKEELSKRGDVSRYLRKFPLSLRSRISEIQPRIFEIMANRPTEELLRRPSEISHYALELGIPSSLFLQLLEHFSEEPLLLPEMLGKSTLALKSVFTNRVLYLPTYRRIEQELAAIFPEWVRSTDFRTYMERWKQRVQSPRYIELVQFGMQDVEEMIERKVNELKDSLRGDLNKLTGAYLRDVIQGVYKSAEPAEISKLDEAAINTIFNRIDQEVLPKPEQERLREIVGKIRTEREIPSDDRVLVHFLTKLIEVHKGQQEKEKDMREFVSVCNGYLSGKEFIYDNQNFELSIRQFDSANQNIEHNASEALKMSMLSSGEKQIVSLFSHIYLSHKTNYFVIIDEPELSLSVFWQKRFLPDILHSGHCAGLIAVTHSPFIIDDESLVKHTYSIEQFREWVQ